MTDWSKAPEWAKWTARDSDGCKYFYNEEPKPGKWGWQALGVDIRCEVDYNACPNWRDSLEMRPGQKMSLPWDAPDWSKAKERDDWAVWVGQGWWYTQALDLRVWKGHVVVARP